MSLSGPSGSSYHPPSAVRISALGVVGFGGACPDGGRLVVENCTVDASIFFDCRPARRHRGVWRTWYVMARWCWAWGLL